MLRARVWLLSLVSLALAFPLSPAAGAGYCDDPERVQRWETLSRKNPRDFGVQALDALRIGLCEKVRVGLLAEREAVEILWSARSRLIDEHLDVRMERFLEREADRRRAQGVLQTKVDRLQQELDDANADNEELALEMRELSLKQMEQEEEYRDRCSGADPRRVSAALCLRIQRRIDDLRGDVLGLQKDLVAAEARRQQAAQRLADAQRRLGE